MGLVDQLERFEQSVRALQASVRQASTAQILEQSTQLSADFQQIIETTNEEHLNPVAENSTAAQQIKTYQTEAHRRLRIIGIEAMKLKTARQPTTVERGRSQLASHLEQLGQFAQAMREAL
ncbi:MAG: hypothetical protein AAFR25_06270 [Cyanobacteria bacterium J06629_19]